MMRLILFFVTMVGSAAIGPAGTIELPEGGHLQGDVRVEDKKPGFAVVQIDSQLSIAVAGVHVRKVVTDEQLIAYRDEVRAAGESAEKHFELSKWCKQQNLLPQSQYHLHRTIQLDPEHRYARAALGYIRQGRDWIAFDELKRSQGLVADKKGRWVLPDVLVDRQQTDEVDRTVKQWRKTVTRLLSRAIKGDAEAIAELTAINDPLAAPAIAEEFKSTRGKSVVSRQLRMTLLQMLAGFQTTPGLAAIVETGLVEPDAIVREEALRLLQQNDASSAVASYLPLLASKDPQAVKMAARALAYFPDPELAFTYIDALTTTQKIRTQQGGGTQAGFNNQGGVGLANGAKTVERTQIVNQPDVLQLLRTIAPDANFGFDKSAWRQYFAAQRSPNIPNLRRD